MGCHIPTRNQANFNLMGQIYCTLPMGRGNEYLWINDQFPTLILSIGYTSHYKFASLGEAWGDGTSECVLTNINISFQSNYEVSIRYLKMTENTISEVGVARLLYGRGSSYTTDSRGHWSSTASVAQCLQTASAAGSHSSHSHQLDVWCCSTLWQNGCVISITWSHNSLWFHIELF